ncbi:MAG: SCO family protein [Sphingobacteriales bacterium]|nr:MAG: SCO family protein [Sphingobacteriales bacterium]
MKKATNKKFILGIAVAVLLPLSFYIIAKLLKKDTLDMPGFYVADTVRTRVENGVEVRDTVFHRISDLTLINQFGDTVGLNTDLKGRVLVINFFFTHCPVICPKLIANMKLFERAFRRDPKRQESLDNQVQLVSITVNPERDSFPVLRKYADRFDVNHDHWSFLTGDKKAIYEFARNELGLSVQPGDGGADDFIHSEKIVNIDQNRHIRGYYDGLDSLALAKCTYDISLITMEKKKLK